uniref:Uncharacterized protein n=1 Tax=Oryza brachyantha TaxID=4533 RepID=J3LVY2_ORYBR
MYDIANSSNGIYGVLNERNLITEAFKSCIDRITSIVVVDTKVDFTCTNDSASSAALLSTVETGQFKFSVADNHKSCSVWLGAIHATSVKNFIFYLDNMGGHGNMSKQFTAQVSCSPAAKSTEDVKENGEKICSSRSGIDRYDEEVEAGIARVAAVKMVTKITDPNFDQQLETCLPGEMETMQKIFASATEKLDANLEKKTADMNYNMKLMQRLPWEMCLRIYEYTREAGKARHEREKNKNKSRRSMMNYQHAKVLLCEYQTFSPYKGWSYTLYSTICTVSQNHVHNAVMEAVLVSELERLEANLDGQITEPSYYQLLVERLMKDLSPQGSGYSAQDAQTDGKVKLKKEKMSMEMENMEACFSIQITDPTNNKELVANLVERMCKSCAKHAQSTGETQLAMELEKMHHRLGKEIVAMICKEVTVPMYYKKFMALIARLKCLNVSERERVVGNARYALRMEKMEATLAREMQKMDTIYLMDYHQIMVVLLVREMFLSVCEHAQIAGGETRLIEDMENMENLLHNEMDNADYYKTLVKSNLSYLLSWLSFRRSCELKSHTP